MWRDPNDKNLATEIGVDLNPYVPGVRQLNERPGLWELGTQASRGDAYVELQYHDNQTTQSWIYNHTDDTAFVYGQAVDAHLNYP